MLFIDLHTYVENMIVHRKSVALYAYPRRLYHLLEPATLLKLGGSVGLPLRLCLLHLTRDVVRHGRQTKKVDDQSPSCSLLQLPTVEQKRQAATEIAQNVGESFRPGEQSLSINHSLPATTRGSP